jgi:hypothetical protein
MMRAGDNGSNTKGFLAVADGFGAGRRLVMFDVAGGGLCVEGGLGELASGH